MAAPGAAAGGGTAEEEAFFTRELVQLRREKAELQAEVERLSRERARVEDRLEFVEELVGPTEAQRKAFQDQLTAARAAALQASRCGAGVPVRFVGRLDECWLRSRGLSERDCALLQRGCVTGQEGVPRDVSLLGDPNFKPYDDTTLAPRWEARGGLLRLSLGDVKLRWGEDVAMEVVRCAIELDRHDGSRRLGVELPWHEGEARELEPAEVIAILERELCAARCRSSGSSAAAAPTAGADEDMSFWEASSVDMAYMAARGSPQEDDVSPTWSMFDSEDLGEGGLEDTGEDTSSPSGSSPEASTTPTSDQIGPDYYDRFDDWSLADADIEQLLRQQAPAAPRASRLRKSGAEAPRPGQSLLSSPRAELGRLVPAEPVEDPAAGAGGGAAAAVRRDEIGEVLRELLEEEVAGPFGRLLAQTPPPGGPL